MPTAKKCSSSVECQCDKFNVKEEDRKSCIFFAKEEQPIEEPKSNEDGKVDGSTN